MCHFEYSGQPTPLGLPALNRRFRGYPRRGSDHRVNIYIGLRPKTIYTKINPVGDLVLSEKGIDDGVESHFSRRCALLVRADPGLSTTGRRWNRQSAGFPSTVGGGRVPVGPGSALSGVGGFDSIGVRTTRCRGS